MANTNTQNKADLRDNLTHLDEKTREMYLRTVSYTHLTLPTNSRV